tara:strand:+ start:1311 stop:1445 length:135 start_codon:yes stop_codon:yes gene_type:complete
MVQRTPSEEGHSSVAILAELIEIHDDWSRRAGALIVRMVLDVGD